MEQENNIFNEINEEIFEEPLHEKKRGDNFLKNKNYEEAEKCYQLSLSKLKNIFKKYHDFLVQNFKKAKELIDTVGIPCHLNLSLCSLNKKNWNKCIAECEKVLEMDINNVKATYRKCKSEINLGLLDQAKKDYTLLEKLIPENNELNELKQAIELKEIEISNKENNKNNNNNNNKNLIWIDKFFLLFLPILQKIKNLLHILPFFWAIERAYGILMKYYPFLENVFLLGKQLILGIPFYYWERCKSLFIHMHNKISGLINILLSPLAFIKGNKKKYHS